MVNFYDKNLRVLNVTHYDFDGAVSACVIRRFYNTSFCHPTGYGKDERIIEKIRSLEGQIDAIVITDFFPKDKWEEIKSLGLPILVLDHHESVEKYNDPANHIFVNTKCCGAKLSFLYYLPKDPSLENLRTLVEICNDYDMWILKDNRSHPFNQLFWCAWSFETYVERWKTGDITLQPCEIEDLKKWKKQVADIWNKLEIVDLPNKGCLCTVESNLTDISLLLEKEGYAWLAMYSPSAERLSLRSKNEGIDLVPIFEELGMGGGHRFAGGIQNVPTDKLQEVIAKIVPIIQKRKLV